jgi:addiction module RelB/DinJ family antitoxin
MTEQVRYRIEKELVKQVEEVCDELGLAPSQAVSMFFSQMVKVRGLPFRPAVFPALEEYGATIEDVRAAERSALQEIRADRKAGKVKRFTGKL